MELPISSLTLKLKLCHLFTHPATWTENKTKADYTLWHLQKGALFLIINGKTLRAEAGDVIFFHPGDTYRAFADGCDCSFLVTFFSLDTGNALSFLEQSLSAGIYSGSEIRQASETFLHCYLTEAENDLTFSISFYAGFLQFLAKLVPRFGTQTGFYDTPYRTPKLKLHRLLSYIDHNLERNIPIRELASFMGMSEKYFISYFNTHIGESPKRYLTGKRMHHALSLLADPALSLPEIARRLDYSDRYAFSKAFKKYFGESPGSFREHFQSS